MFEVRKLTDQRRAESDKESKRLRGGSARKMKRVRKLMAEMDLWRRLGGMPVPGLTEEQLKAMLAQGTPGPWDSEGRSDLAAKMHFGRLMFMAVSDGKRCIEEVDILEVEMLRAQAWISYMTARVQAELAKVDQYPHLTGTAVTDKSLADIVKTYAPPNSMAGRYFWLQ